MDSPTEFSKDAETRVLSALAEAHSKFLDAKQAVRIGPQARERYLAITLEYVSTVWWAYAQEVLALAEQRHWTPPDALNRCDEFLISFCLHAEEDLWTDPHGRVAFKLTVLLANGLYQLEPDIRQRLEQLPAYRNFWRESERIRQRIPKREDYLRAASAWAAPVNHSGLPAVEPKPDPLDGTVLPVEASAAAELIQPLEFTTRLNEGATQATTQAVKESALGKLARPTSADKKKRQGDITLLDGKTLVTIQNAALYLGVGERQIQKLIRTEQLRTEGEGHHRKVTVESLLVRLPPEIAKKYEQK